MKPRKLFAALVARLGRELAVSGPFASRTEARWGADWAGSTSTGVVITCPVPLCPPEFDLVFVVDGAWRGEVVRLPDAVASLVTVHQADPAEGDPGAVVVLVLLAAAVNPALFVGPFDSVADAREWRTRVNDRTGDGSVRCCLLPLRPSQLGPATAMPLRTQTP